MSFLDSVLSSLGPTTRPPQSPLSQSPAPPASSSIQKKEDRNLSSLSRPAPSRPAPSNESTGGGFNGATKRKADDQLPRPSRPNLQPPTKSHVVRPVISTGTVNAAPPVPKSASAPSLKAKTASPNPVSKNGTLGSSRPVPTKPAPPRAAPAKAVATQPAAPAKAPPKGSYAALMEAAKAAQGKAPTQVGVIRNHAAPKERLSKVERKRRLLEAQEKEKAERKGKRFEPITRTKGKVAPKKAESDAPSYKGTAKPSRTPEPVSYRGTANLPTNRNSNDRRPHGKRRMDEYLGTDEEEEEGDYGADDYDNYYSDSSDDMEAGFEDVNLEEDTALKTARREDDEELRMETLAKKAKLERQQKLAALASRTKR